MNRRNTRKSAAKTTENIPKNSRQNIESYLQGENRPKSGKKSAPSTDMAENGGHDASSISRASTGSTENAVDPNILKAINSVMKDHTDKVCEKIDKLYHEIGTIKNRLTDIEATTEFHAAELTNTNKKIDDTETKLMEEIKLLKHKLLIGETYSRKSNLLFYGIKESKEEDTYEVLRLFLEDALTLPKESIRQIHFVNVHRLPRRPKEDGSEYDTPTPIIAKFVRMRDRHLIFETAKKLAKKLRDNKQLVCTDLPPVLKQRRAKLLRKAFELREKHNYLTRVQERDADVLLQYKKNQAQTSWLTWSPN